MSALPYTEAPVRHRQGAGDERHRRVLVAVMFFAAMGNGILLTAGVLYFTRSVHLPVQQVGLGFSIAGAFSIGATVLIGHLADRLGARAVCAVVLLTGSAATAAFAFTESFWPFVCVACLSGSARSALPAATGPVVRRYGGERPQSLRAVLRTFFNLGVSIGALVAGVAVQADTRTAYLTAVFVAAACYLLAAALTLLIPPLLPEPAEEGPRWVALRDRPYLVLTGLVGSMGIHYRVLSVAFPLWLVRYTSAPVGLVTVSVLINTAIVVLGQVPISRGVDSPARAGTALLRAGLTFLVACGLMAAAAGPGSWYAVGLLSLGVVVYTVGELWHSAAGTEISYQLAAPQAQGQYLGVFGIGMGIADAIGPVLLVTLCIGWGVAGWFVVGGALALLGLLSPAAVRWAERHR
ncbi:MFS transporter [Streptomyces sp. NPDC001817]|uniref:MFS transporter n=1 Tax=Streptomyces sp. NPDC001817 TaxID=3154398 RepID=UPI003322D614